MPAPRRIVQLREAKLSGKGSPERPRSRDSNVAFSSDRSSTTTGLKKESVVLSEASLAILARVIGADQNNCIPFLMYLNIPTTTIVHAAYSISGCGMKGATETTKIDLATKVLLDWKEKKATNVKEKEKVKQIDRALKELGRTEWADMVSEKHQQQLELTIESFAS